MKENVKNRVTQLRDESQKKVIERMLAAQKTSLELKRALSLGRHFNVEGPASQTSLTKEEAQFKVKAATKRLS